MQDIEREFLEVVHGGDLSLCGTAMRVDKDSVFHAERFGFLIHHFDKLVNRTRCV